MAVVLTIGVAALDYLGVAGFRAGWALCGLILGAALVAAVLLALERESPREGVWVLTAIVVAIAATAWLVPRAPLSRGRLEAQLDDLTLPLWRTVGTASTGNSRCRASCPTVARTYSAPDTSPTGALLLVAATLDHQDLVPDLKALATSRPKRSMRVFTDREDIEVTTQPRERRLEVVIRLRATAERRDKVPAFRSD